MTCCPLAQLAHDLAHLLACFAIVPVLNGHGCGVEILIEICSVNNDLCNAADCCKNPKPQHLRFVFDESKLVGNSASADRLGDVVQA